MLSHTSPLYNKSIDLWKPHSGQLIPKNCLYAHGKREIVSIEFKTNPTTQAMQSQQSRGTLLR